MACHTRVLHGLKRAYRFAKLMRGSEPNVPSHYSLRMFRKKIFIKNICFFLVTQPSMQSFTVERYSFTLHYDSLVHVSTCAISTPYESIPLIQSNCSNQRRIARDRTDPPRPNPPTDPRCRALTEESKTCPTPGPTCHARGAKRPG